MAECNWKPELHGGKPCPKHGNAGQGSNHQVRISGGKYQTRIGGDDGDWEDISKEEFDELKDGGYEEFDATVDDDFGFDEDEDDEVEEDEEMERGLKAAEEIEAAKPKEPQLRGRWKDEVITDKNRESFLNENGISDRFYWDGADLVDKKSGDEVYSLPRGGAQASYVWDTVLGGEKNAAKEKPVEEKPDEAEQAKDNFSNKDLSEDQIKKTDHIVDYFRIWGRPGRWELQDVVNFYGLTKPMANRVFKSLGFDEEDTKNLKYRNE